MGWESAPSRIPDPQESGIDRARVLKALDDKVSHLAKEASISCSKETGRDFVTYTEEVGDIGSIADSVLAYTETLNRNLEGSNATFRLEAEYVPKGPRVDQPGIVIYVSEE